MYTLWNWLRNFFDHPPWYGSPVISVVSYFGVFFSGWALAKLSFHWQVKRETKTAASDLQHRRRALGAELNHIKVVIQEIRKQIVDDKQICIKRVNRDFIADCRLHGFHGESRDFQNALADVHSNLDVLNKQLDFHTENWTQLARNGANIVDAPVMKATVGIVQEAMKGTQASIDKMESQLGSRSPGE
jgi:hypothetical protein